MEAQDLPEIRNRIYTETACREVQTHIWSDLKYGGLTIVILCTRCGRTPLEMLAQMPLPNGRPEWMDR